MDKAIFLDRDGTINEDVGNLYERKKLIFIPKAIDALKILQKQFLLFIITNQSGIGKGLFNHEDYRQFNDYFKNLLGKEGVDIKEILHCPHTKEEKCPCHKPQTYFIEKLCADYDIDLKKSFCIGDHPHDIEMAYNAGTGSVYLLTGHGVKHKEGLLLKPNYMANNLYKATFWIINQQG